MSEELNDALSTLDDADMDKVEALIQRLAKAKSKGKQQRRRLPPKVAEKIKRSRRKKDLDNSEEQPNVRPQRRKRAGPRTRQKASDQERRPQRRRKKFASREAIQTGPRHNKFLDMQESKMHKGDRKTDKLLSGNNSPTPRMGTANLIEAECRGCGYIFDVHPSVVFNDPDIGPVFECNDCATSRKPNRRE